MIATHISHRVSDKVTGNRVAEVFKKRETFSLLGSDWRGKITPEDDGIRVSVVVLHSSESGRNV
jgi:hypothetical protein